MAQPEPAKVEGTDVPIVQLTPLRKRKVSRRNYDKLLANLKAVGLIEPLCVCKEGDQFFILDGYIRYTALLELGVKDWDIWSCEVSTFDWHYDQKETCYILEGAVTVTSGDQEVEIRAGDLVVFPEGMDCTWAVSSPIRKHYRMG